MREAPRELFEVIHRGKNFSAKRFQSELELARFKVLSCAKIDVPRTRRSRNMAARFANMVRVTSGSLRLREWSRRTTWRSKRSAS